MRTLILALLFACNAAPVDGMLPEGIYGSPDLGLRVDANGGAVFERSCGRGDLGVVAVTAGHFDADFAWIVTGGAPPDSGDTGTPATVSADVTATKLTGTITSAGDTQDLDLTFGFEPTYFECP